MDPALPPLDMHCHLALADGSIPNDPAVLAVTMTPGEWLGHRESPRGTRAVWALGLHPWVFVSKDQLADLFELLPEADAVGEVGVDGTHRPRMSMAEQQEGLAAILAHPETKRRIVSVHGFDAYGELLDVLDSEPTPGAVYHWFMGGGRILERAVEMDIFFSVNDAMFATLAGPEIVARLPRERILVETDAPCIQARTGIPMNPGDPPVPGGPALRPGELSDTEASLAGIWRTTPHQVRLQLWQNLAALEERVERRPFGAREVLRGASGATDP